MARVTRAVTHLPVEEVKHRLKTDPHHGLRRETPMRVKHLEQCPEGSAVVIGQHPSPGARPLVDQQSLTVATM